MFLLTNKATYLKDINVALYCKKTANTNTSSEISLPKDYSPPETNTMKRKMSVFMKLIKDEEESKKRITNLTVLGGDEVGAKEACILCKEVVISLRNLIERRDMTINEVKLTLAIEDVRSKNTNAIDTNSKSDIPREDIVNAFTDLVAGKIPKDRIALKALAKEMEIWSSTSLDNSDKKYGAFDKLTSSAVAEKNISLATGGSNQIKYWLGLGTLYTISAIPLIIVLSVIAILFISSLK